MIVSKRSAGLALMLVGVFIVVLSPVLYLWAVPREEQAFRKTGRSENVFVKRGSEFSFTLDPGSFGIDYARGERLALSISASEKMGIMIFQVGSEGSTFIPYPPTGVGVQDGKIVFSNELNVPFTEILNQLSSTNVRFIAQDRDTSVRYEVLVSFKAIKTVYPFRESNVYLVDALLGSVIVLLGVYTLSANRNPR